MSVDQLLQEHAIRRVLYLYCRGIDRRDYDLVRSCYHPDATDDHGVYRGDLDGFIDYLQRELPRYKSTMHVTANVVLDLDAERASSEAYTLAFHRLRARSTKPERDYMVGLRYVDQFECRAGVWAIADRLCVFEWARLDPVAPGSSFGPSYVMGQPYPHDPVYHVR